MVLESGSISRYGDDQDASHRSQRKAGHPDRWVTVEGHRPHPAALSRPKLRGVGQGAGDAVADAKQACGSGCGRSLRAGGAASEQKSFS
jgi:hypothetical protein